MKMQKKLVLGKTIHGDELNKCLRKQFATEMAK